VGDFREVGVNLLATVIAFVAGLVFRAAIHRFRTRRNREFWGKGYLTSGPIIVLGSLEYPNEDEPTGLIGLGDTHAVQEVAAALGELGVDAGLSYSSRLGDGDQRKNLILIGAEEANFLSADVVEGIGSTFRFNADTRPLTLVDSRGRLGPFAAEWVDDDPNKGLRADYGVLTRATNPLNPASSVVMFGGLYGFATWACARLINLDEFRVPYREMIRRYDTSNFECLFRVQVRGDVPYAYEILALRPLPSGQRERRWLRWRRNRPLPGGGGAVPESPLAGQVPETSSDA
jgi:hypothetical protein